MERRHLGGKWRGCGVAEAAVSGPECAREGVGSREMCSKLFRFDPFRSWERWPPGLAGVSDGSTGRSREGVLPECAPNCTITHNLTAGRGASVRGCRLGVSVCHGGRVARMCGRGQGGGGEGRVLRDVGVRVSLSPLFPTRGDCRQNPETFRPRRCESKQRRLVDLLP